MEVWDLYFSAVCSLRFHPRNDGRNHPETEIEYAAKLADLMVEQRNKRWQSQPHSSPEAQQSQVA